MHSSARGAAERIIRRSRFRAARWSARSVARYASIVAGAGLALGFDFALSLGLAVGQGWALRLGLVVDLGLDLGWRSALDLGSRVGMATSSPAFDGLAAEQCSHRARRT
jgi:hypothetical protein